MSKLLPGLYEQIITEAVLKELGRFDPELIARGKLHPEEVADRIALHAGKLLRRALSSVGAEHRRETGLNVLNDVTRLLLEKDLRNVNETDKPVGQDEILHAIHRFRPDGRIEETTEPATPLLDSTLLTNSSGEPNISHQLKTEIPSANHIDVLMAFVRRSGIRQLLGVLKRHINAGGRLRLLTTTYTQTTELAALEDLQNLGAEVRVSYETDSTRLHAKAWLFHRASGFSTAYIGSSNLTHQAQVTGKEWNVRVSQARNADIIRKFQSVFDSYWENDDFLPFDRKEFIRNTRSNKSGPQVYLSPVEIRPEPFQSRLLELIALARQRGRHRNLLVSATGTGKTVMAALDYFELRKSLPRARLLFVAHRKEILEQSLATFRHALRDANFGELWVGGQRPDEFEHVFASIQSLHAARLEHMPPDHFDVVIIDEFHHAEARTYRELLKFLKPRELLGLTATPERGDGQSILHWFDNRIAAELRLWDAIEQQRLIPFDYHGVADGADFRQVGWTRGRGYNAGQLDKLVTGDNVLARRIIQRTIETVDDPQRMRALGFCVSVGHAHFMADQFEKANIAAWAITGTTPLAKREAALQDLRAGHIRILFTVDLFNEGVDLPEVDTLLMLRPTDSATLYIQQLGRGLRRSENKYVCTVLDFIGQHRREFSFQRRLAALLGGSRTDIIKQIKNDFPYLPSGCSMQLDRVAQQRILDNIQESLPTQWPARVEELRQLSADGQREVSLSAYLDETGLELEDLYKNNRCWSDLKEAAGLKTHAAGPHETALRRALGRLLHVNDSARISGWREFAQVCQSRKMTDGNLLQKRLFHMLAAVLLESLSPQPKTLKEAAEVIGQHPQALAELDEILQILDERIDHLQSALSSHPDTPLKIHARYSRREILAAFGNGHDFGLGQWREGVRWLKNENTDLFAITFDKTSGHFSPTTRYRDYAISPTLLHWESQSTTSESSPTGQRYQTIKFNGPNLALPFVRLHSDERAFWLLGPAHYERHQDERPMAITWKLSHPIPGDLFARFAAAVA